MNFTHQSYMEMDEIKSIAAKLRSNDARDWEGISRFEITADDISGLIEFVKFYKTLFSNMHLHFWPIITREQSTTLEAYLVQFHVQHGWNDHGIDVLRREEHGYEAKSDSVYFIVDDTFTCKTCGKQVPVFESMCDGCVHDAKMRAWMPVI